MRTADNYSSYNNYFFVPMKNRTNADSDLSFFFEGNNIIITAKKIASYVWIYRKKNNNYIALKLEDNYFTLTPGESKIINIGDAPKA
jgi:hypothetical protein